MLIPIPRHRLAALAITGALATLALAGCGGSSPSASSSGTTQTYRVTVVLNNTNNPHENLVACGAQLEAKKLGNVELNVQAPAHFDASLQVPVVNAVTASKPSAMLLVPVDDTALFAPAKQSVSAGIKLVLLDATLKDPSIAVAQLLSDNEGAGVQAAKELARLTGAKGSVLPVGVSPGEPATQARVHGFLSEMKKHPSIVVLDEQFANADAAKAASIVSATLGAHPDLSGVFGTQSGATAGSGNAIRAAQKQGEIKLVGVDGALTLLQQGLVTEMLLSQPKEIGKVALDDAVNAVKGQKVSQKMTKFNFVVANAQNLTDSKVTEISSMTGCSIG